MRSLLVLALLVAAAVAVDLDETRLGKRHYASLDRCALARTVSRTPKLRALATSDPMAVAMAADAWFVRVPLTYTPGSDLEDTDIPLVRPVIVSPMEDAHKVPSVLAERV